MTSEEGFGIIVAHYGGGPDRLSHKLDKSGSDINLHLGPVRHSIHTLTFRGKA